MPGIQYIAAGFVKDAEKLLTEFVRESSTEFSVFTHFWKKHNFAAVFLCRPYNEVQQFTQEVFQLTLKFMTTAERYHQIGSVYLLYALFRNQVVEPPTRIRIIRQQYEHFLELRNLAAKENYKSLHYVIGYLIQYGFDYVAHPSLVGPRNSKHSMELEKKSLQMACMLKDLKDHSLSLFESNSLEEIQELNKTYTELTKSIPFKNNVFQDANDFNMETHIKRLSKYIGANKNEPENKNESETNNQNEAELDNIGNRRAQIKSNAFASKAWFRQLNPTDDEGNEVDEKFTRSRSQKKSLSRKANFSNDSQEFDDDEVIDERMFRPRKFKRKRVPKEKRRIGRPRKDQKSEEFLIETEDNCDDYPFKGFKKRGPVARSSYLDRYVEQPFKPAIVEMTVLSDTSEEEETIKDDEENVKDIEIINDLKEDNIDEEENVDVPTEIVLDDDDDMVISF